MRYFISKDADNLWVVKIYSLDNVFIGQYSHKNKNIAIGIARNLFFCYGKRVS